MKILRFKFNQLLYNSVHIGHSISQSTRFSTWYVFGVRYSTLLLSLSKMLFFWKKANFALLNLSSKFGSILMVNLDSSLNYLLYKLGDLIQQPLILDKWRGGLLTNWKFVFLRKIPSFKKGLLNGSWSEKFMQNLKVSTRLPSALLTFNTGGDFLPFKEAQTVNMPIFSLSDSNLDTSNILYPLPGNDDAVSSVVFYSFMVSKSILVGRLVSISKYSKFKKLLNR